MPGCASPGFSGMPRRAGILEQGAVKLTGMSQFLFYLFILPRLQLQPFDFPAGFSRFFGILNYGFIFFLHRPSPMLFVMIIPYKNGVFVQYENKLQFFSDWLTIPLHSASGIVRPSNFSALCF